MLLTDLLRRLVDHRVRFCVIGGVALVARGVNRATEDLDIAYARDRENLRHLVDALGPSHPRLRGVPGDLPFTLNVSTLRNGLNLHRQADQIVPLIRRHACGAIRSRIAAPTS